jgi:N-acetylglucosamine-6-phosphate deacetylase
MPPVGSDNPEYVLNGQTIVARDGVCQSDDGVLAGSALDMATAVRNAVELLRLPLDEAARMASTYPAEFLGLGDTHGRIATGYRADFALVDDAVRVRRTWIGGVPG